MDAKSKNILILVVFMLLVLLTGMIGYYFINDKDDNDLKPHHANSESEYEINLYHSKNGDICLELSDDCIDKLATISVLNEDAKVYDVSDDRNFVLLDDNGLKIYDVKLETMDDINLKGYDDYSISYDKFLKKVIGIVYYKGLYKANDGSDKYNLVGLYDKEKNKKVFEGKYSSIEALGGGYLKGTLKEKSSLELLKLDGEKVLLTTNQDCEDFEIMKADANYYIKRDFSCDNVFSTIYTENLKEIKNNLGRTMWSIDSEGYLYVVENNLVKKYNSAGEMLGTSNSTYSNLKQVFENYIIYVYNGKLKITDELDLELEIADWTLNCTYDLETSGRRKDGLAINFYKNGNKELYLFNNSTKEISKLDTEQE